jgi:spore germination protein KB
MNKKEVISSKQIASLLLAFLTGSAIINIPSPLIGFARNGAWVSLLISSSCGLLLLLLVHFVHHHHPEHSWIEISQQTFGNTITLVLAIPFLIFLFLMMTWIIIDIGGFFTLTMMPETPNYVFNGLILLTAALTVRAGIEVMGRMFTLLLYTMFFFGIAVIVLSLPNYHPTFLQPIFHSGWKPVLHGVYYTLGFPYAELAIFTMLLPFTMYEKKSKLKMYLLSALLINTISLIVVTLCTIMAFGPLAGAKKYSVFQIARLINIQDFIERVESVIGISLMIGSYMKATIALYILNLAITQLAKLKDNRILIMPIAMSTLPLTLIMFSNEAEFSEKVTEVWPLLNVIGGIFPLCVISIVTWYKLISKKRTPSDG